MNQLVRLQFRRLADLLAAQAAVAGGLGHAATVGVLRELIGDKARKLAGVSFQFHDIRAKAATDTGDLAHSQKLLAHRNRDMTEHNVRSRVGERVKPLR
jgi:hypothetical protein